MFTTSDENGILNNFANEPNMYYATYPTQQQQRRYLVQGIVAVFLIIGVVTVTLAVS
ncbi:ssl1498 family light-harvesting-like protein [Crocosphaera sp. UHCC 0190]|uniref:photosystem II assembly protein Psb34 n=1 Tax=Crocosphaera sp. UHCC 0190 TaxID=3110246 RepID=UPI002B20AC7C|nr:ssl1498 family light-harvesting-like protein [Crocosphaera sp. UHCC 0190]MEA5509232.1 ssl1498 family light-harvesting-like protein [Crocosphaera sp. UHCC 0190]